MMENRTHDPLREPGTLLSTTHPVGAGESVRLRLTRPSDAAPALRFLTGLSEETLQRRFFTAMPVITPGTVRHFTFYDPRERLVVAATMPGEGTEEIVGLGDVSLLPTGLAEIGVLVGDRHQGRGIGRLLAGALGSLAAARGATHVKAEMLERNPAIIRLMEHLGDTVQTVEGGNSVVYATLPAAQVQAA